MKKSVRNLWRIFFGGLLFVVLIFALANFGAFGKMPSLEDLENKFTAIGLTFRKYKEAKNNNEITVYYKFSDKQHEFEKLNDYLMSNKKITGFDM